MSHIPTKKTKSTSHARTGLVTSIRTTTRRPRAVELLETAGLSPAAFATSTLNATSCARFDLNTLLLQMANDVRDTLPMQLDLSPEPLPVFASTGHLSNALQEMARFIARFLQRTENVKLMSALTTAREILESGQSMGQLLFPLTTWNATQHSQRAFGIITMIKEGGTLSEVLVERFMLAARNVGNGNGEEPGLKRIGRVLRKHRANLAVHSEDGVGTIFRFFIPLADVGK